MKCLKTVCLTFWFCQVNWFPTSGLPWQLMTSYVVPQSHPRHLVVMSCLVLIAIIGPLQYMHVYHNVNKHAMFLNGRQRYQLCIWKLGASVVAFVNEIRFSCTSCVSSWYIPPIQSRCLTLIWYSAMYTNLLGIWYPFLVTLHLILALVNHDITVLILDVHHICEHFLWEEQLISLLA